MAKTSETPAARPGYRTTEFWTTIAADALVMGLHVFQGDVLDPQTTAVILGVINGLYAILRTVAKVKG